MSDRLTEFKKFHLSLSRSCTSTAASTAPTSREPSRPPAATAPVAALQSSQFGSPPPAAPFSRLKSNVKNTLQEINRLQSMLASSRPRTVSPARSVATVLNAEQLSGKQEPGSRPVLRELGAGPAVRELGSRPVLHEPCGKPAVQELRELSRVLETPFKPQCQEEPIIVLPFTSRSSRGLGRSLVMPPAPKAPELVHSASMTDPYTPETELTLQVANAELRGRLASSEARVQGLVAELEVLRRKGQTVSALVGPDAVSTTSRSTAVQVGTGLTDQPSLNLRLSACCPRPTSSHPRSSPWSSWTGVRLRPGPNTRPLRNYGLNRSNIYCLHLSQETVSSYTCALAQKEDAFAALRLERDQHLDTVQLLEAKIAEGVAKSKEERQGEELAQLRATVSRQDAVSRP